MSRLFFGSGSLFARRSTVPQANTFAEGISLLLGCCCTVGRTDGFGWLTAVEIVLINNDFAHIEIDLSDWQRG